ncbi:MAG TPA: lipid-transfer protein [Caulobacter sp.]|nr:lipid-transfer protein [Caulobacter sp.]
MSMQRVVVAGVGMTAFVKPGASAPYDEMARDAGRMALADAGIDYAAIQQVYAGYVYGDSTCGQAAAYQLGMTGAPVINVNNNCATGSTALFLARQAVASGAADCVLALGFEQMRRGALVDVWEDRRSPLAPFIEAMAGARGEADVPLAFYLFGGAGSEYQERYGVRPETFAKVTVKARRHAVHNDRAIFRTEVSVEEVLASPRLYGPLTRLQACPPTCGAAAAVICSEAYARKHGINADVVIAGQAMTTDFPTALNSGSAVQIIGYDMAAAAARQAYEMAGIGPGDAQVAEMHDCFTANEVVSYEALGLAPAGGAEKFIEDGDNTYGGRIVVNPSGGLISKGHPLGATGLAQCTELVQQLRGTCGPRQVEGARTAIQHNLGLGGACVVTVYQRA